MLCVTVCEYLRQLPFKTLKDAVIYPPFRPVRANPDPQTATPGVVLPLRFATEIVLFVIIKRTGSWPERQQESVKSDRAEREELKQGQEAGQREIRMKFKRGRLQGGQGRTKNTGIASAAALERNRRKRYIHLIL